MRVEGKKIKYSILSISSATQIDQYSPRIINPTAACTITFDTTINTRSTNAQFTLYASAATPVTIKYKDGSGTNTLVVAVGYTVINTDPNGVPIIGITGTGSGQGGGGFIANVVHPANDAVLTTQGVLVIVDHAGSALTVAPALKVAGNFFYVTNASGANVTFEGDIIPDTHQVGYTWDVAGNEWKRFITEGVDGSGFIETIVYTSTNYTIAAPQQLISVNTAGVSLTTISSIRQQPNFLYITNTSLGDITFHGMAIAPKSRVGVMWSQQKNKWVIFMNDYAQAMNVSHFIGFAQTPGIVDENETTTWLDIYPLTSGVLIDVTKYNMLFDDGSPSWKIIAGAAEVHTTTTLDLHLTTP